jgi:hypothetical protein
MTLQDVPLGGAISSQVYPPREWGIIVANQEVLSGRDDRSRGEDWMQKQRQQHAAPGDMSREREPSRAPGAVIMPASARCVDGVGSTQVAGYAIHTGAARSTEDVSVRDGTAPIIERGQADDDEVEEGLAESTASSLGAPD